MLVTCQTQQKFANLHSLNSNGKVKHLIKNLERFLTFCEQSQFANRLPVFTILNLN